MAHTESLSWMDHGGFPLLESMDEQSTSKVHEFKEPVSLILTILPPKNWIYHT